MRKRLLQVTPSYPPQVGGVGDYCAIVANSLADRGLPSKIVVPPKPSMRAGIMDRAGAVEPIRAQLEQSGANRLLLHFSGYGYASRGLCFALARAVRDWRGASKERRLVTIFHEVYASGPVWRSSFWTAGLQKRIARNLAQHSDHAVVTSEGGRVQLRRLYPALDLSCLPVFSNVGELDDPPPLTERQPAAVIFGGRERKQDVYRSLAADLAIGKALQYVGVTEIIDIGPTGETPLRCAGLPVRRAGLLSAKEVSSLMAAARVGLIHYPFNALTKSGIGAAYFAHGMLVVNACRRGTAPQGLGPGDQFATLQTLLAPGIDHQVIAERGLAWYRTHSQAATATHLVGLLA